MYSPDYVAGYYNHTVSSKVYQKFTVAIMLSIMAGVMIALAGSAAVTVSSLTANPLIARLLSSIIFPCGLMMVIVAGSELFTGNNLLIIPWYTGKITFTNMAKHWGIVYLGNLIGSILVAYLFTNCGLPVIEAVSNIAAAKCGITFTDAFIRGILCNVLVCLAVWMSIASQTVVGKIAACYFPIMAFVFCGYEHSIANMFYLFSGWFADATITLGQIIYNNLLPVTLGNIIGGWFVSLIYSFSFLRK